MRSYRLNPMYWMSRYFAFGIYAQKKDIEYILDKSRTRGMTGIIISSKGVSFFNDDCKVLETMALAELRGAVESKETSVSHIRKGRSKPMRSAAPARKSP